MCPERYFEERKRWHNESVAGFAHRADMTPQTLYDLMKKRRTGAQPEGPTLVTAHRIVKASRAQPTKHGGTIDWEDLLPVSAFSPPEQRAAAS